jgi:hypothetical protein
MDDLFRAVIEYLMHRGMRVLARILEGHNFAAIATLIAGTAAFCIALILIRGLDVPGIAALAVVAAIVVWAVYFTARRVLTDTRD